MRKTNESMAELFMDVREIGEVLLKEYDAMGYLELRLEIPTVYTHTLPSDLTPLHRPSSDLLYVHPSSY